MLGRKSGMVWVPRETKVLVLRDPESVDLEVNENVNPRKVISGSLSNENLRRLPNRDATPQLNHAIWYDDHGSGTFCSPLGRGASAPRGTALLLELSIAVAEAQVPRLLLSAALGLLLSSAGLLADWPRVRKVSFQAPLHQIAGATGIAQKRLVLWPVSTRCFQATRAVKCPKRE